MDIEYLLFLQNLREATDGSFTPLFTELTNFTTSVWPFAILAFFYWVYSRKDGFTLWLTFSGSRFVLNIVKLTCCVYRPWIRDARLVPEQSVIKEATGYSFPSGHSITIFALCGSLAKYIWHKRKGFAIFIIILAAVVGFSRNFLGVHTPQDVLVSLIIALVLIFGAPKFCAYLETLNKKKSTIVLIVGLAIVAVFAIYLNVRAFPIDYVDGKIIVDPETMKLDGYASCGEFLGLIIGWWLNHNFIKYSSIRTKPVILAALFAIIPLVYWDKCLTAIFSMIFPVAWLKFVVRFLKLIYILVLVPIILKWVDKSDNKLSKEN